MDHSLRDLSQLTDAIYRAELNKMRDVNLHEARLRQDIMRLENSARVNAALRAGELNSVRQIGADVLWQGWLSRARHDLNTELAQVLAQKARMISQLRQVFGRKITAAELLENAQKAQDLREEKRHLKAQEHLQMLKHGRTE